MSDEDIKRRARQAAIAGAIAGIREEFPNHKIDAMTSTDGHKASIMISHPTAMYGRVIIGVEV